MAFLVVSSAYGTTSVVINHSRSKSEGGEGVDEKKASTETQYLRESRTLLHGATKLTFFWFDLLF